MKKTIAIIILIVLLGLSNESKAFQTDSSAFISITGIVRDVDQLPASGLMVTVKGTVNSAVTKKDGSFLLNNVSRSATLIISGLQIDTLELPVKADMGVLMVSPRYTSAETVNVVANTGYQYARPNEINGSVSVVDNKKLHQQVGTNVLKRLDGQVPGLYFNIGKSAGNNPQSDKGILIRGLSSINGPLDPIIVLDNFIYEGSIDNINPNDIESITVLKDAAATSIYGARGGNGVIVLTTKKGGLNQRLKIDASASVIVQQKPDLYRIPQMNAADYIDVEQFLFNKGYFDGDITNQRYLPLTPAVEIFQQHRLGNISAQDSATQINQLKQIDNRKNLERYYYQKAITQQYALTLTGGSNNLAWVISAGHDRSETARAARTERSAIRAENQYRLLKNLDFTIGINYNVNQTTGGRPDYTTVTTGSRSNIPYQNLVNDQGAAMPIATNYRQQYIDSVGRGALLDGNFYPYKDYLSDRITERNQDLVAKAGLRWKPIKELTASVNYQLEKQTYTKTRNADVSSFYTRTLINRFTSIADDGSITYTLPKGDIYNEGAGTLTAENLRAQLDFSKGWGIHNVAALAGLEAREMEATGSNYTLYGYQKDPLQYSSMNYDMVYPDVITGFYMGIPGNPVQNAVIINRFLSAYANASYQFKGRYLITGSFRKDGSNIFGLKTNDKWKPLWSAGIGWVLSKEGFITSTAINYLKLRLTFGYSGNVDLSRSPLPIANSAINYTTQLPYLRISTINNPSLKWEQSGQLNMGVDFSMLKDRLSGTLEYYLKKGSDLYGLTAYDYTTWGFVSQIVTNTANMKGKGIDFSINSKNIIGDFNWSTGFLFSYNNSITTKYNATKAQQITTLLGGNSNYIRPVVGKPLYAAVAYKWAGLDNNGNPQGFLNGQKSTDYTAMQKAAQDKGLESGVIKYLGPRNPTIFGALTNTFSYKRLSLNAAVTYKMGYYFARPALSYSNLFSGGIGNKDYANRWQHPGDELKTNIPALVYTDDPQFNYRDNFYSFSENNYLKGDHIRLQYVNLEYDFLIKRRKGNNTPIQIQAYINCANLGIIWRSNEEKLDPDYPGTPGLQKTYAAGVRLKF
ncbi:SusC/RagA family TonB-linked outer membrane protein [Niabella hirudinis]|uniref:SusC/RagA family TonB-linked outer membrane protein n=1 Tax=Niabella hirudinis TaxID=1285929 RepID=UPI003EB83750